eukprot:GCRY01004064.1.p1 GENE.GCRY01004064.1~~GCRY01004064.1.p1  ORF type:complete len:668 (-),score=58.18 GCRY01004064.1:177-2180(-)
MAFSNGGTLFPHSRGMLYEDDNQLLLFPNESLVQRDTTVQVSCLKIDRRTSEITLCEVSHEFTVKAKTEIFGLFGMIRLISGKYLIAITGREYVGDLGGDAIYRVTEVEIFSCGGSNTEPKLSDEEIKEEAAYLELLFSVLANKSYHLSYTRDLTLTEQERRVFASSSNKSSTALWVNADDRFFWNKFLLTDFINAELHHWIVPIIHGFVCVRETSVSGNSFVFSLISRRSCLRAGCRFTRRGIDVFGNVANYAVTEQILSFGRKTASFIQTRGSIPVYWQQMVSLKYTPKVTLETLGSDIDQAFRRHFETQISKYGKQTVINLIDMKGCQLRLGELYRELCEKHADLGIRYIWFDFHRECAKMRYDRLSILRNLVLQGEDVGYFMCDGPTVLNTQTGVYRTNCMDNLDRTNVVQTCFAREVLLAQLTALGILPSGTSALPTAFDALFKMAWADNADVMSFHYSGTGALKNDFTRTGKRTVWGALNDGYNSLMRYFLNNFRDGEKQDALDLLLGVYQPVRGLPSPFRSSPDHIIKKRYWQGLFGLVICFLSLFFLDTSSTSFLVTAVLFLVFSLGFRFVTLSKGHLITSSPRLVPIPISTHVSAARPVEGHITPDRVERIMDDASAVNARSDPELQEAINLISPSDISVEEVNAIIAGLMSDEKKMA